jgi:hypothetical protein
MYSKILVPLDGSKAAENVLPSVRSFARALQIPQSVISCGKKENSLSEKIENRNDE